MSIERKRFECSALPKGWQREEVMRKNGLSAGKVDVYYYSPDGRKVRSKPQLARCLGDSIDYGSFDFRSGKTNSLLLRKQKKQKCTQVEYSSRKKTAYDVKCLTGEVQEKCKANVLHPEQIFRRTMIDYRGVRTDASLVPPIRQTASIFKQPVTVYKTQEGKVKTDFKHGPQEKPKQVFWEKRLEGMRACDTDGTELRAMELPRSLKAVGPHVNEETLLQSVATALHVSSQPITGQTGSKSSLEKNPGVYINPDQPLVQALSVGEDDIKRQEDRVNSARLKLQEAIKAIVA